MRDQHCLMCHCSVAVGSGNWVNREEADDPQQNLSGYHCAECASRSCDRCDGSIGVDDDIWVTNAEGDEENVCDDCVLVTDTRDDGGADYEG